MKTIIVTLIVAALLLVAAALGLIYSGFYDVSASAPHGAVSRWVMHAAMEASVKRRAAEVKVPDLGDESLLLSAVNDFEAMCAGCHGAPGREPGPIGKGLNPAAPDLAESAGEFNPAELFWITKHGVGMTGMPAWGATHNDEELWPVVALMMALPDMDAAAYRELQARAEGSGHHGDSSEDSEEPGQEAQHDHSTHEH